MKHILDNIEKLTDENFLNLYKVIYKSKNKPIVFLVASRNKEISKLYANTKKLKANAVRGLPYFYKNNELFVITIKQFRYTINDYIFECPAGLVEPNETEEQAIIREIEEEIGAKVKNIVLTESAGFTSVGLSDELVANFNVEVELINNQHLDEFEDIEIITLPFSEIPNFIKNNNLDLTTKMQYKNFYIEKLLEKYKTKDERM